MRDKNNKVIGIIGFGNMGQAIAERIKIHYQVIIFDKDKGKTSNVSGIRIAKDNIDLVKTADVLILAVKPQDFDAVLNEIKNYAKDKLIISIAAGITTRYIEKFIREVRIIRAMPNIGVRIGESETSLCKGKNAQDIDLDFAKELFNYLGKTRVMKEEMINAATAISGTGPALIFSYMDVKKIDPLNVPEQIEKEYIKRLKEAAEKVGFDTQTAIELAGSTTASSIHLAAVTGVSPAELIKQVASKGGTTEAALEILARGGSWVEAAEAALKRAEELGKKE